MKLKHLLLGLFAVASTVACEELFEEPNFELTNEALEIEAQGGSKSFDIVSSQAWTATSDAEWLTVEPSSGEGSESAVTVKVSAEKNDTDKERTATVTVSAGKLTGTVAVTQAAGTAEDPGENPEGPKFEVTELYMLGGACDTGWSIDDMTAFENVDSLWVWEGNLKTGEEGKDFRFPLQKVSGQWWPCLCPNDEGTAVVLGEGDGQVSNAYRVPSDGYYKITVNPQDGALTIERTGDYKEPEVEDPEGPKFKVTELYMLGGACDTGWSLDNMTAFENVDGLWVWEGNLKTGGDGFDFRFPLQKVSNQWWPCLCPNDEGTAVVLGEGDGQVSAAYRVPSDGYYKITVNPQDGALKVERTGDYVTQAITVNELYMLGGACDTGWSLDDMTAFTNDNGIFTWTGNLKAGEEFRFPLQKASDQWWPCLMISEDGSGLVYGRGDNEKVIYKVAETGVYTITVDVRDWNNRSYTITKDAAGEPEVPADKWAIVGSLNGWNLASDLYLTPLEDGSYVYYGIDLTAGDEFKFLKGGKWPQDGGQEVGGNGDAAPNTIQEAGSMNIKATAAGKYDIYLAADLSKFYIMDQGKLPSEAVEPTPQVTELYMLGSACDTAWSIDDMTAFTNDNGVFTWTGNLKAGEEFRFPLQKVSDQWWPCLMINDDGSEIIYGRSDADKVVYTVAETGVYTITVDVRDWNNRSYTITKKVVEPKVVTVAEFLAATDNDVEYIVSGVVSGIYSAYNPTFGNIAFYLKDDTGEMLVFRMTCDEALGKAITVADEIKVKGKRTLHNDTPQMAQGGVCLEHKDVVIEQTTIEKKTIAEFAALEDGITIYELTGTITGIVTAYNSSYGNISLNIKDATGEIQLYRLSCEGCADPNALTVGDEITVQGPKGSFNGTAQMAQGGKYISHVDKAAPEVEVPELSGKFVKVAEAPADWSGQYIIVFDDKAHATCPNKDLNATADVAVENNEIAATAEVAAALMTVTKASDGIYNMSFVDGKYFGIVHNGCKAQSDPFALNFEYTEKGVKISGEATNKDKTNTYTLYKNASSSDGKVYYRCYAGKEDAEGYSLPTLYKYVE